MKFTGWAGIFKDFTFHSRRRTYEEVPAGMAVILVQVHSRRAVGTASAKDKRSLTEVYRARRFGDSPGQPKSSGLG